MKPSVLLRCSLILVLAVASSAVLANPSNKWRIEFSGSARSDGQIVLAITPEGGQATEVSIDIKDGDGENRIASKARDALKAALSENYRVSRDDGEDVLVKKRSGQPDFEITLVSNGVEHSRMHLQRE
jgi:type 1 fimbria pilin